LKSIIESHTSLKTQQLSSQKQQWPDAISRDDANEGAKPAAVKNLHHMTVNHSYNNKLPQQDLVKSNS
jgi:hypothetical protein